jgi:hypothetical protein
MVEIIEEEHGGKSNKLLFCIEVIKLFQTLFKYRLEHSIGGYLNRV